jgi:hypothetical protein
VKVAANNKKPTPEAELRSLINRFDARNQKLFRSVRATMRKRFPTANELAYDYPSSVVVSYSPTDKGIDGLLALAARADGLALYFTHGPELPDPKGLLLGSGKQTRFIPVESAGRLAHPDVTALIAASVERATVPLPATGKGMLIMKTDAAKKRKRRNSVAKRKK